MKTIKKIGFLAICIMLAIATTSCKSSKKEPTVTKLPEGTSTTGTGTTSPNIEQTAPPIQPGGTPSATDLTKMQSSTDLPDAKGLENMMPDREFFKAQIVYFDFDRSTIKDSEKSKLDFVAKYLKENSETKIQVEGHCDERGTEEYNRALGERRALAAREYLINAGVSGTRIYTISYGEDKPADPGHNEAAWAKNRRCEFVLYRPKK